MRNVNLQFRRQPFAMVVESPRPKQNQVKSGSKVQEPFPLSPADEPCRQDNADGDHKVEPRESNGVRYSPGDPGDQGKDAPGIPLLDGQRRIKVRPGSEESHQSERRNNRPPMGLGRSGRLT